MPTFLHTLDESIFRFINQTLANPVGDFLFKAVNSFAPFVPLLVIFLLWLAYTHSPRLWRITLTVILAVLIGNSLIFDPLKKAMDRSRPAAVMGIEKVRALASGVAGGDSFPSSHTANAFLVATILALFFPRKWKWCFGIATYIGFARVYVGVHWPSDVLGSAILGSGFGLLFFFAARFLWRRFQFSSPESSFTIFNSPKLPLTQLIVSNSFIFPVIILILIQSLRLAWAATTDLDVPTDAAHLWIKSLPDSGPLWNLAHGLYKNHFLIPWPSKLWFSCFGSSPLSLWAIPWTIQNLWLGTLAGICIYKKQSHTLWGIVFISIFLPIISQLSFLGSPQQIFLNSNWSFTPFCSAAVFYSILALPIWIAALLQFRTHPRASLATLFAWWTAIFFPDIRWYWPLLFTSESIFITAKRIGEHLPKLNQPASGKLRLIFLLFVVYGTLVGPAVYESRFLRKLNLALLPKNTPHYTQIGWSEFIKKIRPELEKEKNIIIITDSEDSKIQIQYALGPSILVFYFEDIHLTLYVKAKGAFYIREVDFAQINPSVIFQPRRDIPPDFKKQMQAIGTSTDIFRKGDPVREFQLYWVPLNPESEK